METIALESFINHCDEMMIANEGFVTDIGKSLHDFFVWIGKMIGQLWDTLMSYVTSHKKTNHQSPDQKQSSNNYNLTKLGNNITCYASSILENLDILVSALNDKYSKISYALFESDDLKYDSIAVAGKGRENIVDIMEKKYSGINRRCISHLPDEVKYDVNGKGRDVRKALADIYDSLGGITKSFDALKAVASPEEYLAIYNKCNDQMMELFKAKVQGLKPLKEGLNTTILVLQKGIPIYSGDKTYSGIIKSLVSDAAADWTSLNNLYTRLLTTFKSYGTTSNEEK